MNAAFLDIVEMAPSNPFLTEEEFRYAAECRRMARLARPQNQIVKRIDIAGYLRALESLGQLWSRFADQPARQSSLSVRR